jgi:hypothetical protein
MSDRKHKERTKRIWTVAPSKNAGYGKTYRTGVFTSLELPSGTEVMILDRDVHERAKQAVKRKK